MNELFAKTIPLALGAIVSPTLLTAAILVLSGRVSQRSRTWAFVAGGAAALAAFTLAVPWVAGLLQSVAGVTLDRIDVILGALLVAVAVRALLKRKNPAPPAGKEPRHRETAAPHLLEYGGYGALMIATDASSLVLYIAILKEAGQSSAPDAARAAAVAMGYLAVMLPALAPAVIATLAPAQTDRILKPLGTWAKEHATPITVVICLVFATYLLIKGLPPLFH